ncbi:MAG: hypothetical protein AAF449_25035, partial [Myxococcota bacterium]
FGGVSRLARIELKGRRAHQIGHLSEVAAGLDTPTTVAVIGGDFAVVVEGQFDHLFGIDPNPPGPFQAIGLELYD